MNEIDLVRGMVQFAASGLDNVMAQARQLETAANAATKAVGATADKIDKLGSSSGMGKLAKDTGLVVNELVNAQTKAVKLAEELRNMGVASAYIKENMGTVGPSIKEGLAGKAPGLDAADFMSRVSSSSAPAIAASIAKPALISYGKALREGLDNSLAAASFQGFGASSWKPNLSGVLGPLQNWFKTTAGVMGLNINTATAFLGSGVGVSGNGSLSLPGGNGMVMVPPYLSARQAVTGTMTLPAGADLNVNQPGTINATLPSGRYSPPPGGFLSTLMQRGGGARLYNSLSLDSGMKEGMNSLSAGMSFMQRMGVNTANMVRSVTQLVTGFRALHEVTKLVETGLRTAEKLTTSIVGGFGRLAIGAFHTMFNSPLKSLALMDDRLRAMSRFIQNSPITRTATILSFGSITGTGEMFGIGSVVRRSFTRLIHEGLSEVTKSSEWSQLGTSITKLMRELLDGLAPYIRMATQLVQELTTAWQGLDQETKNSVIRWGILVVGFSGMVALLPTIIGGLGGLAQVIDLVIKPADMLFTAFGNLAASVIQFGVTAVSTIAKVAIGFAATLANAILSAIGLVGQLVMGIASLAAMTIAMGPLMLVVIPLAAAVIGIVAALSSGIAVTFFDGVVAGVSKAIGWMGQLWSLVKDFASGVPDAMQKAGKGISDMFSKLTGDWKGTIKEWVSAMASGWNTVLSTLSTNLPTLFNILQDGIIAMINSLIDMRNAMQSIYETGLRIWNVFKWSHDAEIKESMKDPGVRRLVENERENPGFLQRMRWDKKNNDNPNLHALIDKAERVIQFDKPPGQGGGIFGKPDDFMPPIGFRPDWEKWFKRLLGAQVNPQGANGFLDKAFNVAGNAGAAALDFVGKAIQWAQNPGNNKDQGLGFGKGGTWGSGQDIFDRIQAGLAATSDPTVKEIAKGNGILGMIKEGIDVIKNKNGIIKE